MTRPMVANASWRHFLIALAVALVAAWSGAAAKVASDADCIDSQSLEEAVKSPENVCGLTLSAPPGVPLKRLGELRRLRGLRLAYAAGITTLPPEVGHLEQLHTVHILCTPVRELPREMAGLRRLRVLTIGYDLDCRSDLIPPSSALMVVIGRLRRLESAEIFLDFRHAPPELVRPLAGLKRLRHLRLGSSLTALPEELFDLTNLETLDLHFNELQTLSPSIRKLARLRKLNVCQNSLRRLPAEIGQLTQLEELDISNLFDNPANWNQFSKEHLREIHSWLPHTKIIEPEPPEER